MYWCHMHCMESALAATLCVCECTLYSICGLTSQVTCVNWMHFLMLLVSYKNVVYYWAFIALLRVIA